MKKRGRKTMILIGVLCVVISVAVYLKVPYSPVKKEYFETVEKFTGDYMIISYQ